MKAPKGQTTTPETGEAQLVAYEYGPGSRPTSTVTSESFGVASTTCETPESSYTGQLGTQELCVYCQFSLDSQLT